MVRTRRTGVAQEIADIEPPAPFQAMIAKAWDVFAVFDDHFVVRYVSPAAASHFGLDPRALVGRDGFAMLDPAEVPLVQDTINRILETPGAQERLEHRLRHGTGRWMVVQSVFENLLRHPDVGGIVVHSQDVTDREVLQSQLAMMEMNVLRMQIRPHFLFNCLNTVHELLHTNVARADAVLMALASLLKMSFEIAEPAQLTLQREIDFLSHYVKIQSERFPNVRVEMDVAPAAVECRVPPLLLQPLVENCYRHAFTDPRADQRIWIKAHILDDQLVMEVADNGCGFIRAPAHTGGTGIAIPNITRRVSMLYQGAGSVSVGQRAGGGASVVVRVPATTAAILD